MSQSSTTHDTKPTTQHTPGPWIPYSEEFDSYRAIWHALDPVIARGATTTWWTVRAADDPDGTPVFVAMSGNGRASEGNARLIAGAPDLLAALRDCVREIQELMAGTTLLSWSVPPARAAIAKAEGRQP